MKKKLKRIIAMICMIVLVVPNMNCSVVEVQAKKISGADLNRIKKCYQFFLDKGFSDAACSGILGNFLTETSTIDHTKDDGSRLGIAQWMGDRYKNLKKRKDWNTLEGQLQFAYEELEKSHKSNFDNTSVSGKGMSYKKFKKKLDDPVKCAELVAVCFEGCYDTNTGLTGMAYVDTYQGIDKRRKYAKQVYQELTGKMVAGSSSQDSNSDNSTTQKASDAITSIVTEFETHTLNKWSVSVPSMSALTAEERASISEIQQQIDREIAEKSNKFIDNVRVAVMLFGILLVVYTLILFLAYWFDRFNSIFEVELLRLVSFGKYYTQVDGETSDGTAKALSMRGSLLLLGTGVLIAMFLMSGKLFSLLNWVVSIYYKITG